MQVDYEGTYGVLDAWLAFARTFHSASAGAATDTTSSFLPHTRSRRTAALYYEY